MSTVQLRRLPRLAAPKMPGGEVHLEPPPEVPRVIPGNIMQKTLPVVMIVAVLGMVAYVFLAPGPDKSNPLFLMFPIMMVLSTVGMFAGGRGAGQAKAEMNEDRKDYLRYLGQMRERARETAQEQRAALEWSHPDPAALWSIAASRRIWERRSSDADFCHVRICRGSQRLATRRGCCVARSRGRRDRHSWLVRSPGRARQRQPGSASLLFPRPQVCNDRGGCSE